MTSITPRSRRTESNTGLEMFSDVHVVTNRGSDYESFPPHSPGSQRAYSASVAKSQVNRTRKSFEIINGPFGVYVVVTHPTGRTDPFGRKVSNQVIMRTEDMCAALHLFDARHSLLDWSEKRWQKKEGGGDSDLLKILKKTSRKTTEADLATWQSHSLTERHPVPRPTGLAGIMHWLNGSPVAHVEKQVGTLHYHEE